MTRHGRFWAGLMFFVALCLAATAMPARTARAQDDGRQLEERILSLVTDIEVRRGFSLVVTETIRIEAQGEKFRHGVYRIFPEAIEPAVSGFAVERVERDGREEPWRAEDAEGGVMIRIGDANVLLAHGEHVYTIRYRTRLGLNALPAYDALSWNMAGDWPFAVERAELRVRLPAPVRFGDREVVLGAPGPQPDVETIVDRPGEIAFRTTRRLESGEALTIGVAWPQSVLRRR